MTRFAIIGAVMFSLQCGLPPLTSAVSAADPLPKPAATPATLPSLAPAKWIWYPSGRTLQNTFILFRRELDLPARPRRATGWIAADSRYLLELNGRRIQWGPAPCDPRWAEADPVDLTDALQPGKNVLGATVLFYGTGDGTWPVGTPGFLFWLEIEHADGTCQRVISDAAWQSLLCRAWPPGHYKRWYLRALQEEFDARLYPYGWNQPGYPPTADWLAAMELGGSPNKPALCAGYGDYARDIRNGPEYSELRPRSIPLMRETIMPVQNLAESLWIEWRRPPEEYFECRTPDAFQAVRQPCATEKAPGSWQVQLDGRRGAVLTFELPEQMVGWPGFTIEAAAGTVVELMTQEAHQVGGAVLLNKPLDKWGRFICREGTNHFEAFDFESLRWLQLHIRGAAGPVTVRDVGVRRRTYPWPNAPHVHTSEPALQRLFDASINTLYNSAQETVADGMGRERQQYSGDGGHQLHAVYPLFGETRLPARFVKTFSQGMTKDGYFLDCWPAFDRLERISQRELDLTGWGPILDHGVGFNFDCWHYYNYTGDLEALREPYPRLVRFVAYLRGLVGDDGLLPVEDLGIPCVWIDHVAFANGGKKQCAFNLYTAAMFQHALAPICRLFGDADKAAEFANLGRRIEEAAVKKFWSAKHGLFINNLPWIKEDKDIRLDDRSLATAVLFDQCPGGQIEAAVRTLAECPREMGLSYPANAGWRLWALAKAGRPDVIVKDFRQRWATMDSVRLNNTLQESWRVSYGSAVGWSHCPLAPLYITYQGLAGIRPLEPGYRRVEIRPQLADLADLELTAHTVRGPIRFEARGKPGDRRLTLVLPKDCTGELVLPRDEKVDLPHRDGAAPPGNVRYRLDAGTTVNLRLRRI